MKNYALRCLAGGLFFVCAVFSWADGGGFQGAGSISITEKANLRLRQNGRYFGYLYKETKSYFNLIDIGTLSTGASEYLYSGTVYVLEDQKMNTRQAKYIDEVYDIELSATSDRRYSTASGAPFPRTRGFPVIPVNALHAGSVWREYGEQVVIPRDGGKPTRIEFYCEFKYKDTGVYLDRDVHVVTAQYATRYKRGQDADGDETLTEATGKHLVTMYIDADETGWMFIRDQVDEQYRFSDGMTQELEGFYLTWYEGAVGRSRAEDTKLVEEALSGAGVEDVTVKETGEGVALSLQNIHFVPDQAIVLISERTRLDSVAEALKSVGERTIKVIGHTAAIGTIESQYELSVERAKVIIEEMAKRGIPADRFIYEGRGGVEPIGSNETEEGRAQNRRVEFVILDL